MSGRDQKFVGYLSGKYGLPDNYKHLVISRLAVICRKCRVRRREKSAGEFEAICFGPIETLRGDSEIAQPVQGMGLE